MLQILLLRQQDELIHRNIAAVVPALEQIDAQHAQLVALLAGLHIFRHHLQPKVACHARQRLDDLCAALVILCHEELRDGTVQLDLRELAAHEIGDGGMPHTKVIDGQMMPHLTDSVQLLDRRRCGLVGSVPIFEIHGILFRDLKGDLLRRNPMCIHSLTDIVLQIIIEQGRTCEINGNAVAVAGHGIELRNLLAGTVQQELFQLRQEISRLREMDDQRRIDEARDLMPPAQQRLRAHEIPVDVELWLIAQIQTARLDGPFQILCEGRMDDAQLAVKLRDSQRHLRRFRLLELMHIALHASHESLIMGGLMEAQKHAVDRCAEHDHAHLEHSGRPRACSEIPKHHRRDAHRRHMRGIGYHAMQDQLIGHRIPHHRHQQHRDQEADIAGHRQGVQNDIRAIHKGRQQRQLRQRLRQAVLSEEQDGNHKPKARTGAARIGQHRKFPRKEKVRLIEHSVIAHAAALSGIREEIPKIAQKLLRMDAEKVQQIRHGRIDGQPPEIRLDGKKPRPQMLQEEFLQPQTSRHIAHHEEMQGSEPERHDHEHGDRIERGLQVRQINRGQLRQRDM